MNFDANNIRKSFPYFNKPNAGVYLDNASTTHKPKCVIDAMVDFYENFNSNVHRSLHHPANLATEAVENTRASIANFINANHAHEIIFTKGTTESINTVAQSYAANILKKNDEVLVSLLEHNSNYLPWIEICKKTGSTINFIPLDDNNSIDLNELEKIISKKTKILAVPLVSNIHGGIMPIQEITKIAKLHDTKVVVDAAQGLANIPIDVNKLGCDFLAASAHKAYGPTGIGFLFAKSEHHEIMTPYQFGGGILEAIYQNNNIYSAAPHKFEAGTPNIAGIIGLGTSINFILKIGFDKIIAHEHRLLKKISDILSTGDQVHQIPSPENRCCIVSLEIKNKNLMDVSLNLDTLNVFTRFGKLCCHKYFDIKNSSGVLRISSAVYNTEDDICNAMERLYYILNKN